MRQNRLARIAPLAGLLIVIFSMIFVAGASGRGPSGNEQTRVECKGLGNLENLGGNVAPILYSYHDLTAKFKHTVNRLGYTCDTSVKAAVQRNAHGPDDKFIRRTSLSTITVNSGAGLLQALSSASAGDRILLDQGTYSGITIRGINVAGGVTVSSMDSNHPAVLTDLNVRESSGISFSNLEFSLAAGNVSNPFQVNKSSDIHFNKLYVHGSLDNNPHNDQGAMQIRDSSNVSVTGSEFEQVHTAITHLDVLGLKISGNYIHDVRMDGIRGGGSSNVEISANYLTDFYKFGDDHQDAIQFWTANTTTSAHDIHIFDNIYVRGKGSPVQGIFMGDENTAAPYLNVVVEGNIIIGSLYHGLTVATAKGVVVRDNQVIGYADVKSWIRVVDSQGVSETNNVTTLFKNENNTGYTESDNKTVGATSDAMAMLRKWIAEHPTEIQLFHGDVLQVLGVTPAVTPPPVAVVVEPPVQAVTAPPQNLVGASNAEQLTGGAGDDQITGGGGGDTITGGLGSNYLRGDEGADSIIGGAGFDDINGNVGNDTAAGGDGNDWVVGGKDNDQLSGDAGDDIVYGNLGADTLTGGVGADLIRGGQDADVLRGEAGGDWLSGDRGADTITGGSGADTFHSFGGADLDLVTDFNRSEGDRVMLDPGTAYNVSQVGGDVHVVMAGGGQLVLAGVNLSTLTGDWIFGA